jgi:MFS superfamily sulfate permease-like transporter
VSPAFAGYVVVVAILTSLVARRKGRSAGWWFVGGFVGGLPILLLASVAPRAGRPWRSRAPLALAILASLALVLTLVVLAVSHSHFTY